uniref:Thioredoxin-related transmembrane protein 1 n=1 Tax=Geotrypetes seraphini TaxID=260995 RepID=A0A6P8RS82_GEOSA|nr:thioredoxin-related transmembrane protein 1 [Geotrypetes seraphini]
MALSSRLLFSCVCCWLLGTALGKKDEVQVITDSNWQEILKGEWMIEFYAPWCPACLNLQPEWEEFAEWGDDLEINVAKVDVTEQPGLSGRFIITALPTIYHCKDGIFRRYQGARNKNDFISFISEREWKSIEPVSSWFGPSSFLMNCMSGLFQLSMWIRQCHNYFTEDIGIPVWGSYIIFALATLCSGLALGLVLVFIADCLCPRHTPEPHSYPRTFQPETSRRLQKVESEDTLDEGDILDSEVEERIKQVDGDSSQNTARKRTVSSWEAKDAS